MSTTTTIAGRYRLVERIGSGGSGAVWRAEDGQLGRQVAVKLVPLAGDLDRVERERARARVAREARAAARLHHPAVVTVFDIISEPEHVAIVMELVDAPNLRQLVRDGGPLSDERAATVAAGIVDVLDAAHGAGVVHRDVKPSNVLVAPGDQVRLTDFGIASLADETRLTRTGVAVGSPAYLAPEQARGEDATIAADLWGLGATLAFALTGTPPFERDRAVASLHAVLHEEPSPAADTSALWPLVARLLAKAPADRPSTDEVRAVLRAVADDEPRRSTTRVMTPAGSHPAREQPVAASHARATRDPTSPPPTQAATSDRRTALAIGGLLLAAVSAVVWLGLGDDASVVELGERAQPRSTTDAADTSDAAVDADGDDEAADDRDGTPGRADRAPGRSGEAPGRSGAAGSAENGSGPDGAAPAREVPEGWQLFTTDAYAVAHPAGWETRAAGGPRIDLVAPEPGHYLRLDHTDEPKPDPEADWEQQSAAFARDHAGYEEVRIDRVDVDVPGVEAAAVWEYEYTEGGERFHAVNLGMTTGACGYALNYQTPADTWSDHAERFEHFVASFDPAGC